MTSMTLFAHLSSYFSTLYQHFMGTRHDSQVASHDAPSICCLPDDILLCILDCLAPSLERRDSDLVQLSSTNHRLRELAAPRLFRVVNLGPSWSGKKLKSTMQSVALSDSAYRYARELHVDLWVEQDGETGTPSLRPRVAQQLVRLILSLPHVHKLVISSISLYATALETAFEYDGVTLSHITELNISPHLEWLVPKCPNLKALSSNDWVISPPGTTTREQHFVKAAAEVTRLQHFSLHCRWHLSTLETIATSLPNISSLGMLGGDFQSSLNDQLPILRRFKRLERLELVQAQKLLRAFPLTHPMAYDASWDHRETMTAAQAHITKTIFRELPCLKELSLGSDFKAWVVARHAGGRIDLKWQATISTQRRRGLFDDTFCTLGAVADGLADQLSLAETLEDRAEVTTLANVLMDEDEAEEQLRLLRDEMSR